MRQARPAHRQLLDRLQHCQYVLQGMQSATVKFMCPPSAEVKGTLATPGRYSGVLSRNVASVACSIATCFAGVSAVCMHTQSRIPQAMSAIRTSLPACRAAAGCMFYKLPAELCQTKTVCRLLPYGAS